MSSSSTPRGLSFKSGQSAKIPKGSAVKFGADRDHVLICSAASDKSIGVADHDVTGQEEPITVLQPGGGGKGLAGGTITRGDWLTSDSNGALITSTTNNDQVVAKAMDDAVAGDIFAVEVTIFNF